MTIRFGYLNEDVVFRLPNPSKQKNAFPPNFIHSLDSSHMMLTSLFCEKEGITFVSVHDCFWTHPSSIEMMNKVILTRFYSIAWLGTYRGGFLMRNLYLTIYTIFDELETLRNVKNSSFFEIFQHECRDVVRPLGR